MTLLRILTGAALATATGVWTARARLLSIVGSIVASGLGTLAVAAGDRWWPLLLGFFLPAAALSRWRRDAKHRRAGGVLDTTGPRTVTQVLANGGVFGVCALAEIVHPATGWAVAALGALSAAAADTWATEIGLAIGHPPRDIRTFRPVPPGTSGGVTLPGSLGMLAGAAAMGTVALLAGFDFWTTCAAAGGGVVGAFGDTLLGATIQGRAWCPACEALTERRIHGCGTATTPRHGWRFMTNDAVNAACTLLGAGAALLFAR